MSLKEYLLDKIKSISDPKLLHELNLLIKLGEAERPKEANEPNKVYMSTKNRVQTALQKKGKSNHNSEAAIDWLEKVAAISSLDHIDDPVEWQTKERRDRTLITS